MSAEISTSRRTQRCGMYFVLQLCLSEPIKSTVAMER